MHRSDIVRTAFLDYFRGKSHGILPSGSAIPPRPDLAFVNAGMNHFLGVIEGREPIPDPPRVANSQKCIRLGGRHSDIHNVGKDGTHHSFFEMLGNWSFGDYFKKEAISYSWEFLTQGLKLPSNKLYVTHYRDDLESRSHWLDLGLLPERVSSREDNFWEMGPFGPCGPCTEIYYEDIELWNLVFMESYRGLDGALSPLSTKHVDTGMGLERLVSVLNGKSSNYDTDLFEPILRKISQLSSAEPYSGSFTKTLDTDYRVLADHVRMITACFSDGLLPDASYRLRNIIRRTFKILSGSFRSKDEVSFLEELIRPVIESLGPHHPEFFESPYLRDELKLRSILEFERAILKDLEKTGKSSLRKMRKLAPSKKTFEEVESELDPSMLGRYYDALKISSAKLMSGSREISGEFAFKLYDTLGFQPEDIEIFARLTESTFSQDEFEQYLSKIKSKTQISTATRKFNSDVIHNLIKDVNSTDDSFKYKWNKSGNKYQFYILEASMKRLLRLGDQDINEKCPEKVNLLQNGESGFIILDKTSFYSEAGGQACDVGLILGPNSATFEVKDVFTLDGVVLHSGVVVSGKFSATDNVKVKIDPIKRVCHMQNHTGSHLFNAALNSVLSFVVQRSLKINHEGFKFDACIFKHNLKIEDINKIEEVANQLIHSSRPVTRSPNENLVSFSKSSSNNVLTIPGEQYPKKVSVISIPEFSEPCCGTHVSETNDVEALTVTQVKSISSGIKSFRVLTGKNAIDARENGIDVLNNVGFVRERADKEMSTEEKAELLKDISLLKNQLHSLSIPHVVRVESDQMLDELKTHLEQEDAYRLEGEIDQLVEDISHLNLVVYNFGLNNYLYQGSRLRIVLTKRIKDKIIICAVSSEASSKIHIAFPAGAVSSDLDAVQLSEHIKKLLPEGTSVRKGKKNNAHSADLTLIHGKKEKNLVKMDDLLNSATECVKKSTISAKYSFS